MTTTTGLQQRLDALIRDVPDFPKPGILFKDITPLIRDANALRDATAAMAEPFRKDKIDHVVGIESRGFILGAIVARELGVGFIPVRKPNKLPAAKTSIEYALEYGTDKLEVHADACGHPDRVLIVDDVLATGGTARATCELIERLGAVVVGVSFLVVLEFLNGRRRLEGRRGRACQRRSESLAAIPIESHGRRRPRLAPPRRCSFPSTLFPSRSAICRSSTTRVCASKRASECV